MKVVAILFSALAVTLAHADSSATCSIDGYQVGMEKSEALRVSAQAPTEASSIIVNGEDGSVVTLTLDSHGRVASYDRSFSDADVEAISQRITESLGTPKEYREKPSRDGEEGRLVGRLWQSTSCGEEVKLSITYSPSAVRAELRLTPLNK